MTYPGYSPPERCLERSGRSSARETGRELIVIVLVLAMVASQPVLTAAVPVADGSPGISPTQVDGGANDQGVFSSDELEELLAPVALYPDPLLAQVLPAASFVDQLDEAARVLQGKVNESRIESQEWDISVKSIAHYPQVLDLMVQKRDWTIAVGQAVVNQSTDVMKAIQALRAQAKAAGNLNSDDKMLVVEEPGDQVTRIEPAQPQVIYVPQYDPEVIYVKESGPSTGGVIAASLISFGVGMAIGAWLNRDCDWHSWRVHYHGWGPGWHAGWVRRCRVHIHIQRNYYINNRWMITHYNRNIVRKNITPYRNSLRRDAAVRRDNIIDRTRPGQPRPATSDNRITSPSTRDRLPATKDNRSDVLRNPSRLDDNRGREPSVRPTRPAPAVSPEPRVRPTPKSREASRPSPSGGSIFGGIRSGKDARIQSNRGRDSRARTASPRPKARPSIRRKR